MFAEEVGVYSRLSVPKKVGDKMINAIRDLTASGRRAELYFGWAAAVDVVYHLKDKVKGIDVRDVLAASVGSSGMPRDIAFTHVGVEREGRPFVTVFANVATKLEATEPATWSQGGWDSYKQSW